MLPITLPFAIAPLTVTPIASLTDTHLLPIQDSPSLSHLTKNHPLPPSQPLSWPPPAPTLSTAHQASHPPSADTTTSAPAPSTATARSNISWAVRRRVRRLCRLLGISYSRVCPGGAQGSIQWMGRSGTGREGKAGWYYSWRFTFGFGAMFGFAF